MLFSVPCVVLIEKANEGETTRLFGALIQRDIDVANLTILAEVSFQVLRLRSATKVAYFQSDHALCVRWRPEIVDASSRPAPAAAAAATVPPVPSLAPAAAPAAAAVTTA